MTRYRVLPLLLLVSSMVSQVIGMVPAEEVSSMPPSIEGTMPKEKKEIGEGIAQRIEELPKELRYKILSSALALRENPKYEIYKKLDVGSVIRGIALNADNTRAITGSKDRVARAWDIEKETIIKELKGHTQTITSVALNADGTLALTGSYDGTVRVWNVNTGEPIRILQVGSTVYAVALSADGSTALTGSEDGIGRLYTSTGELLKELKGHTESITSVALSADGSIALTGSGDETARVWNILTGKSIIYRTGSIINSVALSADGVTAVTDTVRRTVLVLDAQFGIFNTLKAVSFVDSVALSKDGKRALVATHDNKIQVWNVEPLSGKSETSIPLTVLEGHTNLVTALAFGGADFIASGSNDKTALIWKPFALEPRDPQEHQEVLRQAYKETFSRPKFLFPDEK